MAAVDELTREHDFVVELVGRMRVARRGGDVSALAELARNVAAVLGPHTVVEEEGLFPALTEAFPDHVAALRAEHRRIEAVLGEVPTAPPAIRPGRTG